MPENALLTLNASRQTIDPTSETLVLGEVAAITVDELGTKIPPSNPCE
jgi:hypothetical protein